ncbi:hypothetical protein H6G76_01795 [Nostoc sp. FACHB-152]|uniref:TrbI/VirB10 family protein n=1 Tax=unclassified Nostoc TaxID=2593658 RepID=UPI0016872228|nr:MULTISPECIES: TrbI/VirB10 family protein [unclassified Nostoc]MBD2445905.1 hypothetical protein [Nostoc sp. FACHB-152]MBD2467919.1 hypothetical protein [Nostoc sp. FACHB-145]
MTSYSISSEIPPQSLANHPSTEPPKPAEYSDWESKIARLVGFEDESKTVNVEATEELDIPESLTADPQELKAKQPLSTNPFAKLTLVASATFVVVMLTGVFLSQLMGGSGQKANKIATITTPPTTAPRQRNLEQEIETLKTKLALAEQAQDLTAAQQNLRNGDTLSRLDGRTNSRNNVATRTQAVPTPAPTVYLPRPTALGDRIATRPVTPTVVLPPVTQVSPPSQPAVTTPPPPPDPLQEWARLAKLGSYGMISLTGTSAVNVAQAAPTPNNANDNVVAPELSQPQPNSEAQGTRSVPVGTSVKAVVATAIFGETTRSRNNDKDDEDKNTFVIQLKEPLKSANGEVVIPAKTELLAEIKSLSEQGLVQLNVNKIVTVDKGNVIQKALPNNAITIRGVRGKPLIANKFPNSSGSIASMDLGVFILGGIGKAAELYNRTDSRVVFTNNTSYVDNSNPKRNIVAGLFEGGFNSVIPQISQRNQQAIAQLSQQTNVWLIPAGKEVEIYVNQLLQF